VYWLGLGAYLLLANEGSIDPFSPVTLLANVLMVQGLLGMTSLLPVAWTLSIELLFYAQQLGCKLLKLSRLPVYLGYFWLFVYLAMCAGQIILHKDMPTTLPMLMFVACLGHALHLRDSHDVRTWKWLGISGAVMIPAGAIYGYDGGEWNPFVYSASFLGGLALFGAFYVAREKQIAGWLVTLGGWSYAMYLVHPIVSEVLAPIKAPLPILFMAINLLTVLVVSGAVHRWVEKPSVAMGRTFSSSRSAYARHH
jgi:peptidoglycan/LPS O-acetylase OafA/YrhL